jgi:hypothetical protein
MTTSTDTRTLQARALDMVDDIDLASINHKAGKVKSRRNIMHAALDYYCTEGDPMHSDLNFERAITAFILLTN